MALSICSAGVKSFNEIAYFFNKKETAGVGTTPISITFTPIDNKPDIINMSFSGPKDYTALENNQEELINQLHESGTILISSMGNAGNTASNNVVPASYENVISVAGTFEKGSPAKESSHSYFTDISAPFGFEGYEYAFVGNNTNVVSALRYHEGTSFSAPIVASAAALTLMEHKDYTPNQVKDCLLKTAIPFRTKNCDKEYGVGVVNFSNIIIILFLFLILFYIAVLNLMLLKFLDILYRFVLRHQV